jgi:hypothetical protein
MSITFPTNTRTTINQIREAIGREVAFFTEDVTTCPACGGHDPYTNSPINPFCTACSGVGDIITVSGVTISGHVTWNPSETMQWVAGGQYLNYNCRVQVEYTTYNDNVVTNSDYVIVDGKMLKVDNKTYRGVPQINRILIDLKEI